MPPRAKNKKAPRKPDGGSVRLPTDPDHKLSTDQLRGQLLQVAAFQAYMAVAEKGTPAGKKRYRMSDVAAKEGQHPAEAKSNMDPKTVVRHAYKAAIPVGRVRLPSLPPPTPPLLLFHVLTQSPMPLLPQTMLPSGVHFPAVKTAGGADCGLIRDVTPEGAEPVLVSFKSNGGVFDAERSVHPPPPPPPPPHPPNPTNAPCPPTNPLSGVGTSTRPHANRLLFSPTSRTPKSCVPFTSTTSGLSGCACCPSTQGMRSAARSCS